MPRFFPIFLDLQDKPCLVVGAGEVGTRKSEQLLKYGARLTIVAPECTDTVRQWASDNRVVYIQREFQPSDIDGNLLVIGSTNNLDINRAVFESAEERNILANIVDEPDICNFIYGALVERGDLQIAISTSGRSPAYASHLRKQLEVQFDEDYATYLDILGQARVHARQSLTNLDTQKKAYNKILELDLLPLIRKGKAEDARKKALECISRLSD